MQKEIKVIGMMKHEAAGRTIEELVGLRAKSYSFKIHEGQEEKKCKGVKKVVVKKEDFTSGLQGLFVQLKISDEKGKRDQESSA